MLVSPMSCFKVRLVLTPPKHPILWHAESWYPAHKYQVPPTSTAIVVKKLQTLKSNLIASLACRVDWSDYQSATLICSKICFERFRVPSKNWGRQVAFLAQFPVYVQVDMFSGLNSVNPSALTEPILCMLCRSFYGCIRRLIPSLWHIGKHQTNLSIELTVPHVDTN